jgi:hypothetical protein
MRWTHSVLIGLMLGVALPVWAAQPTQRDVLRSISQNVGESNTSSGSILLMFLAAAMLIALLMISQRKEKKKAAPKALNNQGKLLKEINKSVPIKPAQMRKLKTLADQQQCSSPLVLLLCPSILSKAVKDQRK